MGLHLEDDFDYEDDAGRKMRWYLIVSGVLASLLVAGCVGWYFYYPIYESNKNKEILRSRGVTVEATVDNAYAHETRKSGRLVSTYYSAAYSFELNGKTYKGRGERAFSPVTESGDYRTLSVLYDPENIALNAPAELVDTHIYISTNQNSFSIYYLLFLGIFCVGLYLFWSVLIRKLSS